MSMPNNKMSIIGQDTFSNSTSVLSFFDSIGFVVFEWEFYIIILCVIKKRYL